MNLSCLLANEMEDGPVPSAEGKRKNMAAEEIVAVEIGEITGQATHWGKGGEERQLEQSGDDY
jgi:hypothetical protein